RTGGELLEEADGLPVATGEAQGPRHGAREGSAAGPRRRCDQQRLEIRARGTGGEPVAAQIEEQVLDHFALRRQFLCLSDGAQPGSRILALHSGLEAEEVVLGDEEV